MARRFSYAEKGKAIASADSESHRLRIRAPEIDTSNLIHENRLTLMGRLTNPKEQRLWSLIPFLVRRWNLQDRAKGSDLGNGLFQFRFDNEEDLNKVLQNRPYHFANWMVILEQWKPTFSPTFPSEIPFWIQIQGLPLHYWQEKVICNIGNELGLLENHELTKTSARIRVIIDGLKPLIMETVLEFQDGSEVLLTLKYERLESIAPTVSASPMRKRIVLSLTSPGINEQTTLHRIMTETKIRKKTEVEIIPLRLKILVGGLTDMDDHLEIEYQTKTDKVREGTEQTH